MPGSGGQVRTAAFIRMLAEVADVTLVSLGGSGGGGRATANVTERCVRVMECDSLPKSVERSSRMKAWLRTVAALLLPWRRGWDDFLTFCLQYGGRVPESDRAAWPWSRRALATLLRWEYRIAARLFALPPLTVFLFRRNFAALRPALTELLQHGKYNCLWYEHSLMYPFASQLRAGMPGATMICNAHNVESILHARIASTATDADARAYAGIQERLLANMEKRAFTTADLVIACSDEDRKGVRDFAPATSCEVIGNGVDADYFRRPAEATRAAVPTLLFTGGFGYGPNLDAVAFFTGEILPLIHAHRPECRFVFAGAAAATAARNLGISDERITWVSDPADIRPCFYEAWIAVVPLRAGGGTRLKILEAMSMGCAVVSTGIGAEGIPCEPGRHFLQADSAAAFAEAVLKLLADADMRSRLAEESASWVWAHYDWRVLGHKLRETLHTAFPHQFADNARPLSPARDNTLPEVDGACPAPCVTK